MSKSRRRAAQRRRTPFEWALLGVAVVAILAIAGGLVFYSLSLRGEPPDLAVTVQPAGPEALTVTVENKGGTTAEEVVVEVLRGDDVHEVEFRAVPKGDTEDATVSMPGRGPATARVRSYKEP